MDFYLSGFAKLVNIRFFSNISKVYNVSLERQNYVISKISNTRDSVSSGYPNTEKRVKNTTRSGVFLTKFEMFR